MLTSVRLFTALFCIVCLAGCGLALTTSPTAGPTLTPIQGQPPASNVLVRQQTLPAASPTPTATASPTPVPARREIVIWWAAEAYPAPGSPAENVLTAQLDEFRAAAGSPELSVRVKRSDGAGGILSTLRSANPVAPGVVPALALVHRLDLVAAAHAGLIYPLDSVYPPALRADLVPAALALGTVEGVFYGLPYLLDVPPDEADEVSPLDGWLWVAAAPDPERQAEAQRLLVWMMQPERQAAFAQALELIPSQQAALHYLSEDSHPALLDALLQDEAPPLPPEPTPVADAETALWEGPKFDGE